MGLPRSDIRRIFAFAMAGGLGLGALVFGFARLMAGPEAGDLARALPAALLVGLGLGLALMAAVKLALRQAAHDLHTYAVELTDTSLPRPPAYGGDDVSAMRETLGAALAFMPRVGALPDLARGLVATGDPQEALELAANTLAQHLPIIGAVLLTLDSERDALVPLATWGRIGIDQSTALELDSTAIGRALRERRETTYRGLQVRELLPIQRGPELLTLFCLPLYVREQPFATLGLAAEGAEVRLSEEQRAFARAIGDLLTLSLQSAMHRRLFTRESERTVAFEELGGLLGGSHGLDQALAQVLRVAARVTDSAHGTLLLLEADESRVRYRVTLKEGDMLPLSLTAAPILKHGLAGWALRERRADIVEDTERDARWLPVPGLEAMRSVLVVPLLYGERALGVLTLADSTPRHYSRRSLALCSALAAYAVTILARSQYEEMIAPGSAALARSLFAGHVSPALLSDLIANSDTLRATLAPQARALVVLYAGLRGLERLNLEPGPLFEQVLTPYVMALTAIAHEHHGYLGVCENGSVALIFGYPSVTGDMRIGALRAAQAVQATARRLRGRWRASLGFEIALSAGVATGPMVAGVVGDERYSAISLIGAPLAEAARIQRLARPDEVLVADTIAESLGTEGPFPLERLAPLSTTESEHPRAVYRLAPGR